jgi:hypothetical protein
VDLLAQRSIKTGFAVRRASGAAKNAGFASTAPVLNQLHTE